ncbi:MAG: hypothetical protein HY456_02345 [Parcubacteria group bacterium]|nr:hypothetical protein [Parcubacteria group bacterium]
MQKLKPVNSVVALSLVIFTFIWGWQGWRAVETFGPAWWFDEIGHAIFGLGYTFAVLYWIRTYAPAAYYTAPKWFISVTTNAIMTMAGVIWEAIELLWDLWLQPNFAAWLAKAQKDSVDTTIDILVTAVFSTLALIARHVFLKWYESRYPNEALKEAIKRAEEQGRQLGKEVQPMRREHRKRILRKVMRPLRKNPKNLQG